MNNVVYCAEDKRYLTQTDLKSYKITGKTETLGTTRCAVLKVDGDNKTYLKPWVQIVDFHKPGESNPNAKLTTKQVTEMVKEAYMSTQDEVTFASLAKKYGVTAEHVSNIVHGRAWRHVTRKLIATLMYHNQAKPDSVVQASNEMRTKRFKLSPSMAKFIVRDHILNGIPVKSLANKYLMDESSIRRVVTGKAWKATTVPAIEEYSNWK